MGGLFPETLRSLLRDASIVAVLEVDDLDTARPVAEALLRSGVRAMELTLRTSVSLEALRRIRTQVPRMLAGVGTVLFPEQIEAVVKLNVSFAVAPGLNPSVVKAAEERGLPFAPGVATPSDIEAAYALGCRVMKFFPAEPSGGLTYLKSIHAPYRHLDLSFIPLGGINENNLAGYLQRPEVLAVGGSWLAPRDLIEAADWDAISRKGETAVRIAREIRGGS